MTAIFFDLDGTLLISECSYEEIFESACESVGIEYDRQVHEYYTDRFFAHFSDHRPNPFAIAGQETVYEFDLDADGTALAEARIEAEIEATRVPEGVEGVLSELGERHPLGIVTNGVGDVQRRKLAIHGLADLFETVLISEEVGAMKPDPEIFERARHAIPATEYVYVGDSVDHDLPAGDCGFCSVLVGTEEAPAADLVLESHELFAQIGELPVVQ